jgi:hypothetical protein
MGLRLVKSAEDEVSVDAEQSYHRKKTFSVARMTSEKKLSPFETTFHQSRKKLDLSGQCSVKRVRKTAKKIRKSRTQLLFFKVARAGERTRDLLIFVYFLVTLPLSHSGSPEHNSCSRRLKTLAWRRGLVVSSPPATEETGAMGREIESRQGIGW